MKGRPAQPPDQYAGGSPIAARSQLVGRAQQIALHGCELAKGRSIGAVGGQDCAALEQQPGLRQRWTKRGNWGNRGCSTNALKLDVEKSRDAKLDGRIAAMPH